MASALHSGITPQTLSPASKSVIKPFKSQLPSSKFSPLQQRGLSTVSSTSKHLFAARSVAKELEVLPVRSGDSTDQQDGAMAMVSERGGDSGDLMGQVVGGFEGRLSFEGVSGLDSVGVGGGGGGGGGGGREYGEENIEKLMDRAINASIVLAAGSFAVTKLLTIDHDYWHGWTLFEILRYAPQHSWSAYEEALKTNPVLAKMMISGIVYSVGDWIAQCYEGKPLFEFDRARMFRSGLVGFTLHGSLSHYYYEFCEALFPFKDWWVVPAKVAFDQTAWAAVWNSIYYTVVGILRLDSPATIFNELRATFWPMLTAGWKLWPFAHLITYGVIPVEQRLLWVDSIELIWVTILSTYSNEKSEARNAEAEASAETNSTSSTDPPEV